MARSRIPIHFTLTTVVALFLIARATADFFPLTKDTFEKEVGQDRGVLVKFYTQWCGHCKKLAPDYERLGASFRKAKSVLIGEVDCDDHKEVCTKFGVTSYPSIKWFPKGSLEPKDYDGERTAEALAEYVNSQGGTNVKISVIPSNVVVLTSDTFDDIVLDTTKDVLVEFHAPWCSHCHSLAPTYENLADAYKHEKDVVIASIDDEKYKVPGERYAIHGYPTLKFFSKDNKAGEDYEGELDIDSLVTFINDKCGTSRDGNGQLTSTAGIVGSLDKLVKEFISAGDVDDKKEVFTKIEEEAGKLDGSFARYGMIYLKAAQSYMAKGADYARNEIQRLERLLSKSISPVKADEFILKKNILYTFA